MSCTHNVQPLSQSTPLASPPANTKRAHPWGELLCVDVVSYGLLSNDLSSSLGHAVNSSNSAVNNLLNYLSSLTACAVTSFLSSLVLTTARCERDSHSGYEHKCNLFHFLLLLVL